MSLSTLQSQLAALNDASSSRAGDAAAGSTIPSNRRHEEAIGRGLHFSVQHGHAVQDSGGGGSKFRASLRYATAREAADVSTRTIRLLAVESLQRLSALEEAYYHPELLRELAHVWAQHKDSLDTVTNTEQDEASSSSSYFRLG